MPDFDAQRRAVLELFGPVAEIAAERGGDESRRRLAEAEERLRDGQLVTVVCGEFKRGKSSLLNALLDEPGLFPVDVDIATSLVSTIAWAPREEISVLAGRDGDAGVETVARADIAGWVTERHNPRNTRNARVLTIETPNDKLASGLKLVDTPGVGGLNDEHTAVTYGFLPSADAVIFVGDATSPLTVSELDFVRRIHGACEFVIYVVTKIDLRNDYEQVVANTAAKLAEVTGRPAEELLIVPVSSQAKLDWLSGGDPEDLELSNFEALEHLLWEVLAERRGQLLLTRAVSDLGRTVEALLLPLRTELDASREAASDALEKVKADLAAKQARLEELRGRKATWRAELRDGLVELRADMRFELDTGLEGIWQKLETTYLEDERLLADPKLIVDELNGDVGLLLGTVWQTASRRSARLQQGLEERTGLTLERPELGRLRVQEVPLGDPVEQGKGRRGAGMRKLRDVAFVGGVGGGVGGMIGAVCLGPVGYPLGAALGGLIGAALGYRNALGGIKDSDRLQRRASVSRQLRPLSRTWTLDGHRALDAVLRQFTRAVEGELEAKIELEHESLTAALATLPETRRRTAAESARRAAQLEKPVRVLETARGEIIRLAGGLTETAGDQAAGPDDTGSWADER